MKKLSVKIMGCMVAITVAAASMLSGCGSSSANQNPTTGNSQPTQAAASTAASTAAAAKNSADIKGNISYWSHNNPAFVDANKKLIADFQKQFPNVKVNYQNFPYDVTAQKLKASFAAKNEPDVFQPFGAWMPPYLQQGVIAEVPADMSADFGSKFYEGAIVGYMKDGKYYGVPRETNVEYGLFYVPEKLKAAGIDGAPKTFDDLLKAAKANVKFVNNAQQYGGFEFFNYDNTTFLLLSWIKQLGGDYWAQDKKHINFETKEAEQAWQRLVDLINVDKVTDLKHITAQVPTEQYFFSGKAAMIVKGPWAAAIGDELKNKNWAFGIMPPLVGDKSTFVVEPGWAEVVSARSKNLDADWAFVNFITGAENSKYWNTATGTIPSQKAVAEDQAFANDGNNARIKDAFASLKDSTPIGPVMDTDFLKQTIYDTFQSCVQGKQDTKVSLKKVQDLVNKHIDQLLAQ